MESKAETKRELKPRNTFKKQGVSGSGDTSLG